MKSMSRRTKRKGFTTVAILLSMNASKAVSLMVPTLSPAPLKKDSIRVDWSCIVTR